MSYKLTQISNRSILSKFITLCYWWEWQQEDLVKRLTEHAGKAFNNTEERSGTLDYHLTFMSLWDDVEVSKVMRTNTNILCYRY